MISSVDLNKIDAALRKAARTKAKLVTLPAELIGELRNYVARLEANVEDCCADDEGSVLNDERYG